MSLDTPGLWAVTAPAAPALAPLSGDSTADIAIVGAGYTGLSAALTAAESGARVIVLEAEGIGAGGSGRNVGLVNAGLWIMPDEVEARLSPGNPLPEMLANAPAAVWAMIERHQIACEARPVGTLHCAPDAIGLAALAERERQWQARQVAVRLLSPEETRARTGSDHFHGALFDPRAGTVQPLAYARGLGHAALRAGVRIHAPSPVTSADRKGGEWILTTPGGKVMAPRVIWAGNAYGQGPAANKAVAIMPYFNFATDPLPEELRRTILPGGEGAWDTATVLSSFRLDAAGRFVIGSIGQLGVDLAVHEGWARRMMARLYPQLRGQAFAHRWYGRIGTTPDALPRLIEAGEGAFGITGYNGRGIAPGTVLGRALARAALGEEKLPPLAPARPDPLRGIRTLGLRAGAAAMHLIDRRG
ncbi:NAD(P)/FAD-dependent oxidoreductase [Pararhodobacter aggregans]|uniref:NAD(P)/FAD-dependent oxidoreductase n=1 Tax=Pararhodobacter aggregans TaxID=404875 RepID=UPI003A9278F4